MLRPRSLSAVPDRLWSATLAGRRTALEMQPACRTEGCFRSTLTREPMAFEYPISVGVVRVARARSRGMVRFAGKGRRRRPSRRDLKGYNLHGGSAFTIRAEG